ncbi:MAG: hypothetical protein IJ727_11110, partial [Treponema sp.]|nr:hypothetical protein [Treponema sp.]
KADEATVFFSTGFSESTAKTLKSLAGTDSSAPLFNKNDVLQLLRAMGAENATANIPSQTEIAATGTVKSLSQNRLFQTGLIKNEDGTLTLTIGPKQIVSFYGILNEDEKSYLDMMMIPALLGEKMSVTEYRELLSSMYGPSFADEIIKGKLTIVLSSPSGKKKVKEEVSLGDLLCSEKEMVWTVRD